MDADGEDIRLGGVDLDKIRRESAIDFQCCYPILRAIHLGRSMPSGGTVSYAACLDEAISATSSQGNANTDSCGGASLPG